MVSKIWLRGSAHFLHWFTCSGEGWAGSVGTTLPSGKPLCSVWSSLTISGRENDCPTRDRNVSSKQRCRFLSLRLDIVGSSAACYWTRGLVSLADVVSHGVLR